MRFIIWSKWCLAALWEYFEHPYPLTPYVCTLPGGATCVLCSTELSLPFTDLAAKPSAAGIAPYSSWHPGIPSMVSPNLNGDPGDDAIGSPYSKRALLFILSDSGGNNLLWLFWSHISTNIMLCV